MKFELTIYDIEDVSKFILLQFDSYSEAIKYGEIPVLQGYEISIKTLIL